MYHTFRSNQFTIYNKARSNLIQDPDILINLEQFLMNHIYSIIKKNLPEIKADYNEASHLYPFWQNYPPDDRGRQPIKDQYPWIEVGEHAIGCKLPRLLSQYFTVRDIGLPTGADQRFLLTHPEIDHISNKLTQSVWVFIDIKSVGPRDDQAHTVMSHNQISGDGLWHEDQDGVTNTILQATGSRASHNFHSSMPPLFVLSDGTIAPTIIIVIKPVYSMVKSTCINFRNSGQPLIRIDLACIPNGLLLTQNPMYLKDYPSLLFPGKDDKTKDPRKLRARISFELLRKIASWRYQSLLVTYP